MNRKRSISAYTLLSASVSAILGSGWLFSMYYTSILAGPAALFAWLLGGAAVVIIAFIFAELCTMLPITGSSVRIPQYTHGGLVGFLFSWMVWLSYATLVPTEVQAVLQYLSYFFSGLVHANGGLTGYGYLLAGVLMLGVSALNIFSLRWLLLCNNTFTVLKIIIPVIISLSLLLLFFHHPHFDYTTRKSIMPFGIHGILTAVASGGILFAFNGFKQACEMAGEAKNPYKTLPFAIIGSVIVCLIIYLLLQFAFLVSVSPSHLTHGWRHLYSQQGNSPLALLLQENHLKTLLPMVYLGAIIGPLAAALMYASSAGRSLYGMSMNQQLPDIFKKLTGQGNPIFAIITNFILGMCLFAPLPGWNKMITFLTSLMTITYGIGPICLLALRKQLPDHDRPFKLPAATLWSTLAFYICTLMAYWSGWEIISRLGVALIIGLLVLLVNRFLFYKEKLFEFNWKASIWIWPYFLGLTAISYYGNFGLGKHLIPFGWDLAILAPLCVGIMALTRIFKLPAEDTQNFINQLELNAEKNAHEGQRGSTIPDNVRDYDAG